MLENEQKNEMAKTYNKQESKTSVLNLLAFITLSIRQLTYSRKDSEIKETEKVPYLGHSPCSFLI